MKKYKVLDYIATKFADRLPNLPVRYDSITDEDYITILSWCEEWEPEKVYNTAYEASQLPFIQTWEQWSENMTPLPGPVRYQLKHGLQIHEKAGNLKALRAYAYFYDKMDRWIPRILFAIFFISAYYIYF